MLKSQKSAQNRSFYSIYHLFHTFWLLRPLATNGLQTLKTANLGLVQCQNFHLVTVTSHLCRSAELVQCVTVTGASVSWKFVRTSPDNFYKFTCFYRKYLWLEKKHKCKACKAQLPSHWWVCQIEWNGTVVPNIPHHHWQCCRYRPSIWMRHKARIISNQPSTIVPVISLILAYFTIFQQFLAHQENPNMLNSCLNMLNVVLSRNKWNNSALNYCLFHVTAKLGFAIHFEWQLPNVIAPSISNGLPWNLIYGISHMLSRFL